MTRHDTDPMKTALKRAYDKTGSGRRQPPDTPVPDVMAQILARIAAAEKADKTRC